MTRYWLQLDCLTCLDNHAYSSGTVTTLVYTSHVLKSVTAGSQALGALVYAQCYRQQADAQQDMAQT